MVGGGDHHREHHADRDVDQVASSGRPRVAAGEVVLGQGGRPDQERAHHEQPGHGEHEHPVGRGALARLGPSTRMERVRIGAVIVIGYASGLDVGSVSATSGGSDLAVLGEHGQLQRRLRAGQGGLVLDDPEPRTPYRVSQILRTAGPEVPEPVPPWETIAITTYWPSHDASQEVPCLP